MDGYTVAIVLPMQPVEGVWSSVRIERVARDAYSTRRVFASFESARRSIAATLSAIRCDAETVRELACDTAYNARARQTADERFVSADALRQYHLCEWRINQIDLLLQRVDTLTAPATARHIAIAPSIRIAHRAIAA